MKVIFNPKCSKCNEVKKILDNKGISFEPILYLETGVDRALIEEIIEKSGLAVSSIVRTSDENYKVLTENKELKTEELIDLLCKNPQLLQRPIVITSDKAIVARPVSNMDEIL